MSRLKEIVTTQKLSRNESIELCSEKEITLLSRALLSEAMDTNSQLSTTITLETFKIFMLEFIILSMADLLENNKLKEAGKLKSNT